MMQRRQSGRNRWVLYAILILSLLVIFWNVALRSGGSAESKQAASSLSAGAGLGGAKELVDAQGKVIDQSDPKAWQQLPVVFFTILNKPRYYWCEMLASAWHNEITMNIWGWGNTEFNDWLHTWMKIPLTIEFSADIDDDVLIGFVDGADSLFQKKPEQILEAYEQAKPGDHLFLMSSEINCAVQALAKHGCNNTVFPMTPHGRRYLNSGLYLGPAGNLRTFLKHCEQHVLPNYRIGTVQRNDQSVIGKAYHDGWHKNFTIDASTEVFQSVRMAEGHYCQPQQDNRILPIPDAATGLLRNCLTNNTPSIFHFNGYAKPYLGKWLPKFWWYGKAIPANAGVFVNKKPVSLQALCPKLQYQ
ncbi:Procollagen-lysine [Diplonema papillatum]|nr:Procollagen-lysine [Diplonema papillatum]